MKPGARYEWVRPRVADQPFRNEIREKVCYEFECSLEEFLSKSRKRKIVDARGVYCHLVRKHTNDTLMRIAIEIGWRDHASVINLIKRTEDLIYVKDPIADVVQKIESEILNN